MNVTDKGVVTNGERAAYPLQDIERRCYVKGGWVVAYQAGLLVPSPGNDFRPRLVAGPELTAFVECLSNARIKTDQAALDNKWRVIDLAAKGDSLALKEVRIMENLGRLPRSRDAGPPRVQGFSFWGFEAVRTCRACGSDMVVIEPGSPYCFCSNSCADSWGRKARQSSKRRQRERAREGKLSTCEHCRQDFKPKRADARFCSGRCRVAAHRKTQAMSDQNEPEALAFDMSQIPIMRPDEFTPFEMGAVPVMTAGEFPAFDLAGLPE